MLAQIGLSVKWQQKVLTSYHRSDMTASFHAFSLTTLQLFGVTIYQEEPGLARTPPVPKALSSGCANTVSWIRELRPQVLVTFGPDGIYGHYDHIAVHRWVSIAYDLTADPIAFPTA